MTGDGSVMVVGQLNALVKGIGRGAAGFMGCQGQWLVLLVGRNHVVGG